MKTDFIIFMIKTSILAVIGVIAYVSFLSINTSHNRKHIESTFNVAMEKFDAYLATTTTNSIESITSSVLTVKDHTYIHFNTSRNNEWFEHDPECLKCKK